jgi:hypothetical protein
MPAAATRADVARFVNAWGDTPRRPSRPLRRQRIARTATIFQVTAWLRYLKRCVEPLPSAVPGTDVLTDLLASLRDERGFAPATVANHERTLRPFLARRPASPAGGHDTGRCGRLSRESECALEPRLRLAPAKKRPSRHLHGLRATSDRPRYLSRVTSSSGCEGTAITADEKNGYRSRVRNGQIHDSRLQMIRRRRLGK